MGEEDAGWFGRGTFGLSEGLPAKGQAIPARPD
nr:MAG TPA: hypothetical protein [Caudoviricetes sp.]